MDVELLLESHESNIDSKVNFGELRLKICQCFPPPMLHAIWYIMYVTNENPHSKNYLSVLATASCFEP